MGQRKKITLWVVIGILAVVLVVLAVNQVLLVRKAHSSFENYYAFRGCVQLLEKTDTYATCALASGQTIKIVVVNGKWYLDGDLPVCYFGKFCW
jgi:uncharacterized protein YpmB